MSQQSADDRNKTKDKKSSQDQAHSTDPTIETQTTEHSQQVHNQEAHSQEVLSQELHSQKVHSEKEEYSQEEHETTKTVKESQSNNEQDSTHNSSFQTERAEERSKEDAEYVPVIVKRTDEAVRHPDDILEKAINEGVEQIERPTSSLLLSAVAAGLILGFTAMAVAVVATLTQGQGSDLYQRVAMAFVYPLGFIICIMSATQLFTEHTATAVYPVLEGRATVKKLFRLWSLVIIGNLIGAVFSAGLLTLADDVIQAKVGYISIGHHLVHFDNGAIIVSAILAGWLMAMGGWLIVATPPNLSQMFCIYIVTFVIGLGGLHHSIAGSVEMFTAYFISDQFSITQAGRFIGLAIFGNLVGGSIFVAILNYGHIRKTQELD